MHERIPSHMAMAAALTEFRQRPRIALLATVGDPLPSISGALADGLKSVFAQACPDWELWLVVEASEGGEWQGCRDPRIRFVTMLQGASPLATLNDVLRQTSAEFVARIDLRDRLAPHALFEVASFLRLHAETDFLYTDEDRLDARGSRVDPQFKPQWSPDTLLSFHYTGDLAVYRRSLLLELGGWREDFAPAEDYDLALRVCERTSRIERLAGVLYHRRRPVPPKVGPAEVRAKANALRRRGIEATVEGEVIASGGAGAVIRYAVHGVPLVSILVPTRDHVDDLRRCVESVRDRTSHAAWELVVVDNGSQDAQTLQYLRMIAQDDRFRVVRHDIPFNFARLNNLAVREARGNFLLFLNNDTEVLSADWLERMLGFAQQPRIGAVGARLLYPDGSLQHSGVARVGPGPTHVFGGMPESYPHPRVQLDGNWSAVTAACMMVERRKFEDVGGFDEEYAVVFNDVDLCYALLAKGYRNVLASHARLLHREFATRGNDRADAAKRTALEAALRRLDAKWPQFVDDPCYNPNLSDSFPDFMPRN